MNSEERHQGAGWSLGEVEEEWGEWLSAAPWGFTAKLSSALRSTQGHHTSAAPVPP